MTCSIKADKKLSTHSFKQFLNSDTLISVALKIYISCDNSGWKLNFSSKEHSSYAG